MRRPFQTLVLLFAAGCTKDTPQVDDSAEDTDTAGASVGPCSAGSWGALADPASAAHVRADGTGDGSEAAPAGDLATAVAFARAGGLGAVFVGPGTFDTTLGLDARDDGLSLLGCGAETILAGDDAKLPVIDVAATAGLVIEDLAITGGRRALTLRQGATAAVSRVELSDSGRIGVMVDGAKTVVTLTDVSVADPEAERVDGASVGYGVVVQSSASLTMTGGGVSGATAAGIVADSSTLVLTDVIVSGTVANDEGLLGRGIQLQNQTSATITGGSVDSNVDGGIFALRVTNLELSGVTIDATQAGLSADGITPTGDGVVVASGDGGEPAGTYLATITDCTITSNARAAVVVAGASVEVSSMTGNTFSGNGYEPEGNNVVVQDSAIGPPDLGYYDTSSEGVAPLEINEEGLGAEASE